MWNDVREFLSQRHDYPFKQKYIKNKKNPLGLGVGNRRRVPQLQPAVSKSFFPIFQDSFGYSLSKYYVTAFSAFRFGHNRLAAHAYKLNLKYSLL